MVSMITLCFANLCYWHLQLNVWTNHKKVVLVGHLEFLLGELNLQLFGVALEVLMIRLLELEPLLHFLQQIVDSSKDRQEQAHTYELLGRDDCNGSEKWSILKTQDNNRRKVSSQPIERG
jgi:hypothetical protein